MQRTRTWRPWLLLNGAFAVLAAAALLLPGPAQGWRVLALVVGYHVATAIASRGDPTLRRSWLILAPLSVLMVLPDWFLSAELGVLYFPDNGGPFIGSVPLAMAGMWTIALMPVVGVGIAAADRNGAAAGVGAAGLAGLVMFTAAEFAAPAIGLWEPVGVAMTGPVATYVVLPEVVLSICAYLLVATDRLPAPATAWLTFLLPFTYLGLLASSYQFLG
jgi:hypothetical protein